MEVGAVPLILVENDVLCCSWLQLFYVHMGGNAWKMAIFLHRYDDYKVALIYWLALCESPIIDSIGFTPDAPGKTLPSHTNSPLTPYTSWLPSTTAFLGSAPIRQVPIWWAVNIMTRLGPMPWRSIWRSNSRNCCSLTAPPSGRSMRVRLLCRV